MLKRLSWLALVLAAAAFVSGCAHPISLGPDLDKVSSHTTTRIDKKVGYFIADAERDRQVITPGGGGDKVSYYPYRDLETALYKSLTEVFTGVSKVSGPADAKVQAEKLQLLISPRIITTSSSPSLLTWPPTQFGIELMCTVTDAQGQQVAQINVRGDGHAEFDDFKGDHSRAAKRASEEALKNLIDALSKSPALSR